MPAIIDQFIDSDSFGVDVVEKSITNQFKRLLSKAGMFQRKITQSSLTNFCVSDVNEEQFNQVVQLFDILSNESGLHIKLSDFLQQMPIDPIHGCITVSPLGLIQFLSFLFPSSPIVALSYSIINNTVDGLSSLSECEDDGALDRLTCPADRRLVQLSQPKGNGCGPAMLRDLSNLASGLIPDEFHAVCNRHDMCYGSCGVSRKECDDAFLKDLKNALNSMPGLKQVLYGGFPTVAYNSVKQFGCVPFQESMMANCGCAKLRT